MNGIWLFCLYMVLPYARLYFAMIPGPVRLLLFLYLCLRSRFSLLRHVVPVTGDLGSLTVPCRTKTPSARRADKRKAYSPAHEI